jgi:type VI secretion system secreted protein VgrG
VNAAGRPINATTKADLGNLRLGAGVYAGPSHGALGLTGPLTLDGAGDPNSVFIFQTNSTLITASSSTVKLINGANACNVYWQVGSSATLGTGSVFVGNIVALTSITVNNSVTVHGRALARNGAVTLNNDTFTKPTCAASSVTTTTAAPTTTAATPTSVASTATAAPTQTLARTGSSNGPSPRSASHSSSAA